MRLDRFRPDWIHTVLAGRPRVLTALVAMLCGLAVVFCGGLLWLMLAGSSHSLRAALAIGFYPFIVADLVKVAAAAAVMPGVWKITRTREP